MPYKDPIVAREKHKGYHAKWNKLHPEKRRRIQQNANLRKSFGIGIEDFEKLHAEQNGLCAICQRTEQHAYKGKIPNLCVDHDHKTGKIRALLCMDCNRGIGCFDENILITTAALEYLRKHVGTN